MVKCTSWGMHVCRSKCNPWCWCCVRCVCIAATIGPKTGSSLTPPSTPHPAWTTWSSERRAHRFSDRQTWRYHGTPQAQWSAPVRLALADSQRRSQCAGSQVATGRNWLSLSFPSWDGHSTLQRMCLSRNLILPANKNIHDWSNKRISFVTVGVATEVQKGHKGNRCSVRFCTKRLL